MRRETGGKDKMSRKKAENNGQDVFSASAEMLDENNTVHCTIVRSIKLIKDLFPWEEDESCPTRSRPITVSLNFFGNQSV